MVRPSPYELASVGVTTTTQWRMTASMTTFKIVGDMGFPCVTHRYSFNGSLKYLPALDAIVRRSQYDLRSRTFMGPTPYAARRSRSLYRYNTL